MGTPGAPGSPGIDGRPGILTGLGVALMGVPWSCPGLTVGFGGTIGRRGMAGRPGCPDMGGRPGIFTGLGVALMAASWSWSCPGLMVGFGGTIGRPRMAGRPGCPDMGGRLGIFVGLGVVLTSGKLAPWSWPGLNPSVAGLVPGTAGGNTGGLGGIFAEVVSTPGMPDLAEIGVQYDQACCLGSCHCHHRPPHLFAVPRLHCSPGE